MTTTVLRSPEGWWVEHGSQAAAVDTAAVSTAELLADRGAIDAAAAAEPTRSVDSLQLLSPVTAPCRVVAQMTNYASHAADAGFDPAKIPLTFFRKASGSITGPNGDVRTPPHVKFLDYEVEIGLVIGRDLPVGTAVDASNWRDWVAGLVLTNDVSARDVQLTKTQFYEAKSYPTFTPVGPALVLTSPAELAAFDSLRMTLSVNGQIRQQATVGGDMIHPPAAALAALARFQHLSPGDLVLTGTPVGTALSAPPKAVEKIAALLPPATKWKLFFKAQAKNPKYLHDGDVIDASAATADGALDLGSQHLKVVGPR